MTTQTGRELVITVPHCPPAVLFPNKKAHFMVKARAAQEYGAEVRMCAVSARNEWESQHGRWHTLPKCRLQLVVTYPFSRHGPLPDADNLTSACKCLIDSLTARERGRGVVGAGIIEDDRIANIDWLPTVIGRGDEAEVRIVVREI